MAAVSHHKMCTSALTVGQFLAPILDRMDDAELSAICKRGGGFEIPMGDHPEMYTRADYVRLGGKCLALLEDYQQTEEQREMILDNVFTDAWFTGFSDHQKRLFHIDMLIYEMFIKNLRNPEFDKGKYFVELLGGKEVVQEHYHDTEGVQKLVQLIQSGDNWGRHLVDYVARMVREDQDLFDVQHFHIEKAVFACETEEDIDTSYCNIFDMKEVAHIVRKVRDRGGKSALVKLIVDNLYKGDVQISGIHKSRHAFRMILIESFYGMHREFPNSAHDKYRQNMGDMVDYNPGNNPNIEVFVRKMFERRDAVEYAVGVLLEYYPDNLIETLQERVRVDANVTSKVEGIMKLFEDLRKEKDGNDLVNTAMSHLFSLSTTIDVSISSMIVTKFPNWNDPTAMKYLIMKLLKGNDSKSVSYEEIEALLNEVKQGNLDPVPINLYAGKDGRLHRGKSIPKKSISDLSYLDPGIDQVDINSHAWKVVIAISLVAIMLPVHRLELYHLWYTPTKKERRDAARKREKMLLKGRECDGPNCSNVAGMRLQSESGKKDKKGKKVHLYACERCMAHYYCCGKCQKEAWPRHKIWCWFKYFERVREPEELGLNLRM